MNIKWNIRKFDCIPFTLNCWTRTYYSIRFIIRLPALKVTVSLPYFAKCPCPNFVMIISYSVAKEPDGVFQFISFFIMVFVYSITRQQSRWWAISQCDWVDASFKRYRSSNVTSLRSHLAKDLLRREDDFFTWTRTYFFVINFHNFSTMLRLEFSRHSLTALASNPFISSTIDKIRIW